MSKRLTKIFIIILLVIFFIGALYVFLPNFSVKDLMVIYPFDGTVFPPEIVSPTIRWDDAKTDATNWSLRIEFQDTGEPIEVQTTEMEWTPERELWESIKKRSLEKTAKFTVVGYKKILGIKKILSEKTFSITTSSDEVGAPIFFRVVTLPFEFAVEHVETIQWVLGNISSDEPPSVVLENMPVCGNCHSFSTDGKVIGMDVDYANDKGSYFISDISEDITLSNDRVITWSEYKRDENELTFGLLSQMSPDGRYAVSMVKDRSVFVPVNDLYYSQLFFPLKGILVYYDTETNTFNALPGADDKKYVQSNPSWSPDLKYIIFAKNEMGSLGKIGKSVLLSQELCQDYITRKKLFKFDLYRIPFNDGKGGEAVPLEGASNNGMSNYFAKYSPDGKWIVFCKASSFMLLQPDSRLYIMPAEGGTPREMTCNTNNMNSWHSWSPNGRWLVFSSKVFTPYTQLFLTHIDENGNDSPPVLLSRFTPPDRAANIPEFVNMPLDGIWKMHEDFIDYYSYANKGGQLFDEGRYEESEKFLRKSIEMKPDFADSHKNLGYLLTKMNRAEEAVEEWRIALELDPEDYKIHLNLGSYYLDRNEFTKAKEKFETTLKLEKKCGPAHVGLGLILSANGDINGARKKFETAIEVDPEDDTGHYRLGTYFMEKKEYEKAEKSLRTAYELNPLNANVCFVLGGLLSMNDRNIREAISMYNKALALLPGNLQGHIALGNLYMKSGNRMRAISEFEKALKLNPNDQKLRVFVSKMKQQI